MALGAIEALQTYQSDAVLVGVDGAVEATQAIIGGDMAATVAQNPYAMGKVGVQQATKAANGKSIDPRINTGITLVTKENAPRYLKIREVLNRARRRGGEGRMRLDCSEPAAAGGRLTKAPESILVRLRRPPGTPLARRVNRSCGWSREFAADSLRSMVEAVEGRGN